MAKGRGLILGLGLALGLAAFAGTAKAKDKEGDTLPPLPDNDEDRQQVILAICACMDSLLEQKEVVFYEEVALCALTELFGNVDWPDDLADRETPVTLSGPMLAWWQYVLAETAAAAAEGGACDVQQEDQNGEDRFDVQPIFEPSETVCFRDDQPFNAALFPDPAAVSSALIDLGFPVTITELYKSDAVAQTPLWQGSDGYAPERSDTLKEFQAVARSMGLPGYQGAGPNSVDGVIGECTLRSMAAALDLKQQQQWPYGLGLDVIPIEPDPERFEG